MVPVWSLMVIPFLVVAGVLMFKCPKCMMTVIGIVLLVGLFRFWASLGNVSVNRTTSSSVQISPFSGGVTQAQARITINFPTTEPTTNPSGKLWVDNWEAFINGESHRYLRADAPTFGGSEQESRQDAREQAAQLLIPFVAPELRVRLSAVPGTSYVTTDKWLLGQIRSSLGRGEMIKDEQVVRIAKPYGDVWSARVLVDASPQKVQEIARQYASAAQRQVESTAVTWGGLGALTLVILLTYAFLNWATKGYFVWRLRAAAVMVVILALLAVMAFA